MAYDAAVNAIINNALALSNAEVARVDAAAQSAITASEGFAYPTSTDVAYDLTAVEPDVLPTEDATLTFEAQLEQLVTMLSSQLASFFTQYYPLADDAFDEATAWLVNSITLGGTGISPAVEDQIWQRGRDRIVADGQRIESQAMSEFAARGFSLPSGVLAGRLQEIRFEQYAKTQELARDTAIDQAKMEVENLRFAVDLAIKSRMQAMDSAVNYIRALMSSADSAARVALLNSDARSRMVAATADLYRARLTRDEIAMRIPLSDATNKLQASGITVDGFYKGIANRVQASAAAADAYGRVASSALSSLNSVASVASASFT